MVRTRFAPSPTGFMHVGGARTALFAWLVARQANGQFLLRIEDTDRTRHVEQAEQHIMDTLRWLGLLWDEEPLRQSGRLDIYKKSAEKLVAKGRAYADTRSPEELEAIRKDFAAAKKPVLFRERRPDNPPTWQPGMPLRFMSDPKEYKWHDEVMGELSSGPEAVDDFILLKSDGFPTYNFAHIIDDDEMKISHVIRSQEFLPSVPKFLNLYEALDIERPKLATLPFVLGPDGKKKLSKRDGAKDILDYKKDGYLPDALVSFLATLGWNDGTEQEIFSPDELIKKFSLDRVQHGGARFDEKRLEWVNGRFIREMPLDELYKLSGGFWPDSAKNADEGYKKAVLSLIQERLKYLSELEDLTHIFFEPPDITLEERGDMPRTEKKRLLEETVKELSDSDFAKEDLIHRLNNLLEKLTTTPSILFELIRMAIAGGRHTPPLADTLHVLGKDKSLERMDKAISALENKA